MTFARDFRLIWIDAVLSSEATLNRTDLVEAFGISIPQASIDIRAYRAAFGEIIEYDRSDKVYRRTGHATGFPKAWHWPVLAAQIAVKNAKGIVG